MNYLDNQLCSNLYKIGVIRKLCQSSFMQIKFYKIWNLQPGVTDNFVAKDLKILALFY